MAFDIMQFCLVYKHNGLFIRINYKTIFNTNQNAESETYNYSPFNTMLGHNIKS